MSDAIRAEFNQQALDGRAAQIEPHHLAHVQQLIQRMNVQPHDRILEIGCGEGWASRMLAKLVPEGMVAGLDAADEMIHNARMQSSAFENLMFIWGEADAIPWQERFFTQVLCVDSFYYFGQPERAAGEILRVLSPKGSVWLLNEVSQENPASLQLLPKMKLNIRIPTLEEYRSIFEPAGFSDFHFELLPPLSPQAQRDEDFVNSANAEPPRALLLQARRPPEKPIPGAD
jgi:SAM-dependent methyltransferase